MLRVHRFAAAIDMIAAGTRAPVATAAKATPANQLGNIWSNRPGTIVLPSGLPPVTTGLVPALTAMYPRRASRPSTNEYAGSAAMFRLIVLRSFAARTAVMECG